MPGLLLADAAFAADAIGVQDVLSIAQDSPVLAGAAAALVLGGVALASQAAKPARYQATGAKDAYEALTVEERTVLVDIRPKSALKEEGVVDLKAANKKAVSVAYAEPDEEGDLLVDPEFMSKLQAAAGVSEDSILVLLDSDGSLAPRAAAEVANEAFFKEKVYWVRDGMEGPKGWKASELPTKPYRVFELPLPSLELPELPSVDLSALAADLQAQVQAQVPGVDISGTVDKVNGAVTSLTDKYKENPTLANGILAVAGVAVVGAFAISELEAILQVVGALGLARFLASNLLFAKDREEMLANVRAFLKERGFDSADSSGNGSGSEQRDLQTLASIVMGARSAESAAQQITQQMVPDVKGANPEALAAALAAAGIDLSSPAVQPAPPAAAVAEPPAAAATAHSVASAPPAVQEVAVAPLAEAAPEPVAVMASTAPAEAEVEAEAEVGMDLPAESPAPAVVSAAAEAVTAVEDGTASADVAEAREWIAAWKERRASPLAEAVAAATPAEAETTVDTLVEAGALEEEAAAAPPVQNGVEKPSITAAAPALESAAAEALSQSTSSASEAETAEAPAEPVLAAAPGTAVPANVGSAREWIAAWKASRPAASATATAAVETEAAPAALSSAPQTSEALAAAAAVTAAEVAAAARPVESAGGEAVVAPNVLEAREWIAAWKAGPATQQVVVGGDGVSDSDPVDAPVAVAAPTAEAEQKEVAAVKEEAAVNVLA